MHTIQVNFVSLFKVVKDSFIHLFITLHKHNLKLAEELLILS